MSTDTKRSSDPITRANAICPYFTMFPLEYPLDILQAEAGITTECVLDPFGGRGTTAYAARMTGRPSVSIDSSPIATAIAAAKMQSASPEDICSACDDILLSHDDHIDTPQGEFWQLAYDPGVLKDVCMLRHSLLQSCASPARIALRGILLGALHGPLTKSPSHLSNQCPRTYAPKPSYAVRFWRSHHLLPPQVDVREVVRVRAYRYFGRMPDSTVQRVVCADSRDESVWTSLKADAHVSTIITSPPYYGMETYIPDQWLRSWFLGGSSSVEYTTNGQITHRSRDAFASDLRRVWVLASGVCLRGAHLHVRFGAINSRSLDSQAVLLDSLRRTRWIVERVDEACPSPLHRRQSETFSHVMKVQPPEYDLEAVLH